MNQKGFVSRLQINVSSKGKVKESVGCTVISNSLWPYGLYCPWNSPGKNIGVGYHSLLQGISPTQGSYPGPLHCRQILYRLGHLGSWSKKYGTKTEESPWCNLREDHSLQAQGSLGTIDDEALVSPRKDELSLTGQSDHKVQILLAGEGIVYRFILRGSAKVVWRAELMTKVGKKKIS